MTKYLDKSFTVGSLPSQAYRDGWARTFKGDAMVVHVVSSFENAVTAKRVMRRIEDAGHQIAYDWTACSTAQQLDERRAHLDSGFHKAEVVVIVLPAGRSSHVEMGLAIGRGVPVILFGASPECFRNTADGRVCSYYAHPAVRSTTIEGDVAGLVDWRGARAAR